METQPELMQFFKGLADGARLQIAGRLAASSATAEQLADTLGHKPAAVTHHLTRLVEAGLVEAPHEPAGAYRLRLDHIHAMAGRWLTRASDAGPESTGADDFERRVLRDWLRADGAIREFPAQEKKFQVLVRYAAREFVPERRYTEKEVNTLLKRLHPDSASLRRALVDGGLLARAVKPGAPSEYWRAAA